MKRIKTIRTFELSIERSELFAVQGQARSVLTNCAACGRRTQFIKPEQAARTAGTSVRMIFHRIEEGIVHYLETAEDGLLICTDSLRCHARD